MPSKSPSRVTSRAQSTPRVGDRVSFPVGGGEQADGVIVEDRGPIGVHGRHLYRIELQLDSVFRVALELPATAFQVLGGVDLPGKASVGV